MFTVVTVLEMLITFRISAHLQIAGLGEETFTATVCLRHSVFTSHWHKGDKWVGAKLIFVMTSTTENEKGTDLGNFFTKYAILSPGALNDYKNCL